MNGIEFYMINVYCFTFFTYFYKNNYLLLTGGLSEYKTSYFILIYVQILSGHFSSNFI